jgi:predicted RNA-binding protein
MVSRSYWRDLFTGVTWREFNEAGGTISGFREGRWPTLQKIKAGDYLLCYLTGVSCFIGVLEVTSPPFKDSSPIWKDENFPCKDQSRRLDGPFSPLRRATFRATLKCRSNATA